MYLKIYIFFQLIKRTGDVLSSKVSYTGSTLKANSCVLHRRGFQEFPQRTKKPLWAYLIFFSTADKQLCETAPVQKRSQIISTNALQVRALDRKFHLEIPTVGTLKGLEPLGYLEPLLTVKQSFVTLELSKCLAFFFSFLLSFFFLSPPPKQCQLEHLLC